MKEELEILKLALPIALYNFLTILSGNVDALMIGQLGEKALVSLNIANQANFIIMCLMFGIVNSASVFLAQFWGKKDEGNMYKVFNLCLIVNLCISFLSVVSLNFFGYKIITLYSDDAEILKIGSKYLKIVSFGYIFIAISSCCTALFKNVRSLKLPTIIGGGSLLINIGLNYLFINGKFIFPQMGVEGLAYATLISRAVELSIFVYILIFNKNDIDFELGSLISLRYSSSFIKKFFKIVASEIFGGLAWVLGIASYNSIYSRLGTTSFAAMNIASTVESFAFFMFIGLSNAASIVIGNKLGEGENNKAFNYAKFSLVLAAFASVVTGGLLFLGGNYIIGLYNVSNFTKTIARYLLIIYSLALWMKVLNMVMIDGILSAGGDAKYSFILSTISMWCVGIPLVYIAAKKFKFPIYIVSIFTLGEEIVKLVLGYSRFNSRRWIKDVTGTKVISEIKDCNC